MTTIICKLCLQEKDVSECHKQIVNGKAYYYKCKPCWNSDRGLYAKAHREASRRYYKKYPEKLLAHNKLRAKKEELRKESCEECGERERLELHHPDYTQPFYVITLCIPCHSKVTNITV